MISKLFPVILFAAKKSSWVMKKAFKSILSKQFYTFVLTINTDVSSVCAKTFISRVLQPSLIIAGNMLNNLSHRPFQAAASTLTSSAPSVASVALSMQSPVTDFAVLL